LAVAVCSSAVSASFLILLLVCLLGVSNAVLSEIFILSLLPFFVAVPERSWTVPGRFLFMAIPPLPPVLLCRCEAAQVFFGDRAKFGSCRMSVLTLRLGME